MASKTSRPEEKTWPGPRIDHATFAARLAARRAQLGEPELPRNAGEHRTASKRALLAALEALGAKW